MQPYHTVGKYFPRLFLCLVSISGWGLFQGCKTTQEENRIYHSDLLQKDRADSWFAYHQTNPRELWVREEYFDQGNLSKLIDVREIIFLSNDEPIGTIDKIEVYNDRIFILDKYTSGTLLQFEPSGKFVQKIGRHGEGPGECVRIGDVHINPFTNKLNVWDDTGRKMMIFSLDGQLLEELPIDVFASLFAVVDTSAYMFYKGNSLNDPDLNVKFLTIDPYTKTVLSKDFEVSEEEQHSPYQLTVPIAPTHKSTHFLISFPFDYDVYEVSGKRISLTYRIDLGPKALTKDQIHFQAPPQEIIKQILDPSYFSVVDHLIETECCLYFNFGHGKQFVWNYYYKETDRLRSFNNIKDDLFGGGMGMNPITVDDRGVLYFSIDPGTVHEVLKRRAKSMAIPALTLLNQWQIDMPLAYQIISQTSQFDNPVLVLATFKTR